MMDLAANSLLSRSTARRCRSRVFAPIPERARPLARQKGSSSPPCEHWPLPAPSNPQTGALTLPRLDLHGHPAPTSCRQSQASAVSVWDGPTSGGQTAGCAAPTGCGLVCWRLGFCHRVRNAGGGWWKRADMIHGHPIGRLTGHRPSGEEMSERTPRLYRWCHYSGKDQHMVN